MDDTIAKKPKLQEPDDENCDQEDTSSTVAVASSGTTMEMMPAEVIDAIIQYVVATRSLSSVLNARVDKWRWTDLVNYQLGREYQTNFRSLELEKLLHPDRENQWIESPKLRLVSKTLKKVWCPKFFFEGIKLVTNYRTPTTSLIIDSSSIPPGKEMDFTTINLETFMSRFGKNLTYLTITNVNYRSTELAMILNNTPNLTGLLMINVHWYDTVPPFINAAIGPHPSLTYIKLCGHTTKREGLAQLMIAGSEILYMLLRQLTHLTISGEDCNRLQLLHYEERNLKLRELVLSDVKEAFFVDLTPFFAPIERLVINNIEPSEGYLSPIPRSFENVWKFVEHFAPTLFRLHLKISTAMVDFTLENTSLRFKTRFSKVKTLAITFSKDANHLFLLSECILPQFPALQKLELLVNWDTLDDSEIDDEIELTRGVVNEQEYWNICKKLKEIEVYSNTTLVLTMAVPVPK